MEFTQDEIKDMREFYERELSSTLDRLRHIERVLDKIGGNRINVEVNVGSTATKNKTSRTTTPRKRKGKKRGPKSIWGNFVIKKLTELDKPITYDELVDEAMKFANVPPEKEKNIRQSIINVTFRLRAKENKIDTFSKGTRIKYIALKNWFDSTGAIDPAYAKKAKDVKPKPTKKGTARKKSTPRTTAKKAPATPRKTAAVSKAKPAAKKVAPKAKATQRKKAATPRKKAPSKPVTSPKKK